jgi:alpha-ketoglutarate-dependent 2,4-dichlorophenoxyacetate dioxygenase
VQTSNWTEAQITRQKMDMRMHIEQLSPFAGRVTGVDLSQISSAMAQDIRDAMDQHGVLVFPGQHLSQDAQIAFAESMGPLELGFRKIKTGAHRLKYNELADISNVTPDGEVAAREHAKIVSNLANQLWHSDSSFQMPRAKYSMLAASVVPDFGGETEFADLRMAFDALPDWRKNQVSNLHAVHSALHSRFMLGDTHYTPEQVAMFPPVVWPLVQTDPRTGRKILFVGSHVSDIQGMVLAESRLLVMDLLEHATQRHFVYTHHWQVGDLVMWDNTATLHRGRYFDLSQRRELRRATTQEVQTSPEAQALMA